MYYYYTTPDTFYVTLLFVIPAFIFSLIASASVKSTFNKYSKITTYGGATAAECARRLLASAGIYDVRIERVSGNLTDHYDPRTNVIRLSDPVYNSNSVASIGVACHEAGHAIQHAKGYVPVKIRTVIIPLCNIGSNLAMPLVILGLFLSILDLAYVGVALFGLATVFQLVTLPVEFDASRRAIRYLRDDGVLSGDELAGAKKTLTAAAMTYVAALAVSLANLLRLFIMVKSNSRRR